jgi:hypothetical protein
MRTERGASALRRVIVIVGMKRSGNHAVASWLLRQDQFLYFNNVLPMRPILTGKMTVGPPRSVSSWLRRQLRRRASRAGSRVPALITQFATRGQPLLVGLEDHPPEQRVFLPAPALSHVLVVRDPVNMLASRIRKASRIEPNPAYPLEPGPLLDRIVRDWKAHAREFLGETNVLENKVCLDFARWFAEESERRRVSGELGLRFDDSGFSTVSRIGGGSSFDGTGFDGDSRQMRVLDRREELTEAERRLLDRALVDRELLELARALEEQRALARRQLSPAR